MILRQPWLPIVQRIPADEIIATVAGSSNAHWRVWSLSSIWREMVVESRQRGPDRIRRVPYEICVLQALREKLRCKEIWVEGAQRYRNPEEDLPQDCADQRATYCDLESGGLFSAQVTWISWPASLLPSTWANPVA